MSDRRTHRARPDRVGGSRGLALRRGLRHVPAHTAHGASPDSQAPAATEIPQGVHRLPEPGVSEGNQLAIGGQALQWLTLEEDLVAGDAVEDGRLEHEEAAVDPGAIADRLLLERTDARGDDALDRRRHRSRVTRIARAAGRP